MSGSHARRISMLAAGSLLIVGIGATGAHADPTDPTEPGVSIGDAQVSEGDTDATLSFPVTVTDPSTQPVTVHYATSDGTATAGSDYTATSGDLTIAAGQSAGQVDVPVLSDTVSESDESMTVTLTTAGYGTLADDSATGTIIDDDPSIIVDPAGVHLNGTDNGAKADRLRVNAKSSGEGARATLYRKRNGSLERVRVGFLNKYGNIRFAKVSDKNGNAKTTYKLIVAKTSTSPRGRGVTRVR